MQYIHICLSREERGVEKNVQLNKNNKKTTDMAWFNDKLDLESRLASRIMHVLVQQTFFSVFLCPDISAAMLSKACLYFLGKMTLKLSKRKGESITYYKHGWSYIIMLGRISQVWKDKYFIFFLHKDSRFKRTYVALFHNDMRV